mgnify:CR=1 FL=1
MRIEPVRQFGDDQKPVRALSERFGVRVGGLVCEQSQRVCGDPGLTGTGGELGAVKRICGGCRAAKIIALSDKLSNMRAISRFANELYEKAEVKDNRYLFF